MILNFKTAFALLFFSLANLMTGQNCTLFSWNENAAAYDSVYAGGSPAVYLDSLVTSGFYTLEVHKREEDPCRIYFKKGRQFERIYLNQNKAPNEFILNDAALNKNYTLNLDGYVQHLKDSLENLGQPFSEIAIIPKGYFEGNAMVEIQIRQDSTRKIDAVKFVGYDKIPKFVGREILRKNLHYSPGNIEEIQNEIDNYTFLSSYESPRVSFTKDSSTLYIYVKKRRQSFFDGLVGFESDEEGDFNIQGKVRISLLNAFNRFEQLDLEWESGLNKSQLLDFGFHIPYIFNTRLGVNSRLNLQKQDSSFVRLQLRSGLVYQFTPNHYLGGNFNLAGSNFIDAGQSNQADYAKNGFGVSYFYQSGNPEMFKETKTHIQLSTGLWKRRLKDDEEAKTDQTEIIYRIQRQQHIFRNHYLFSSLQGSNLIQEGRQLENDMYLAGGFNSLRGFNQNSIVTSSFNMLTLAYRFIPSDQILFEAFGDIAFIEPIQQNRTQTLGALGLGMQFMSRFGIFQLAYAAGRGPETGFDFSNGKIHIGIINYF